MDALLLTIIKFYPVNTTHHALFLCPNAARLMHRLIGSSTPPGDGGGSGGDGGSSGGSSIGAIIGVALLCVVVGGVGFFMFVRHKKGPFRHPSAPASKYFVCYWPEIKGQPVLPCLGSSMAARQPGASGVSTGTEAQNMVQLATAVRQQACMARAQTHIHACARARMHARTAPCMRTRLYIRTCTGGTAEATTAT